MPGILAISVAAGGLIVAAIVALIAVLTFVRTGRRSKVRIQRPAITTNDQKQRVLRVVVNSNEVAYQVWLYLLIGPRRPLIPRKREVSIDAKEAANLWAAFIHDSRDTGEMEKIEAGKPSWQDIDYESLRRTCRDGVMKHGKEPKRAWVTAIGAYGDKKSRSAPKRISLKE